MIKTVIKRDGRREDYDASKVNDWGKWASNNIPKGLVDWSGIVLNTVSTLPEEVTTQQLHERLIQACLDQGTWSYYLMAGRLYASHLFKVIHGGEIPHLYDLHKKMQGDRIMIPLNFSREEYDELNDYLRHEVDLETPHFALHYARGKYSLRNRVTGQEYETQQFIFMRMAMTMAEGESSETKVQSAKAFYDVFSSKQLSAPTPNYVNMGTELRGYASCCLYAVADTEASLSIGDHIAYRMTAASAGIGGTLMTRSLGDPVRGGLIQHQGKLPYYAALGKAVRANMQSSRGGACTTYFSAYDPEAQVITNLRNPRSTEDRRNRDLHYAMVTNKFFAEKVAKNEEVFSFNSFTAPKLSELLYSGDTEKFREEYERLERDETFNKKYFNARDLIIQQLNEGLETGVAYLFNADNVNSHTPYQEPIYSSNLCLSGDTITFIRYEGVETALELYEINDLVNSGKVVEALSVNIETGEESYQKITASAMMNESAKVLEITDSKNNTILATPDHKVYTKVKGYIPAGELEIGDILHVMDFQSSDSVMIKSIMEVDENIPVYDITVDENHNFYANNILVHNCLEIMEPTKPYHSMTDLYSDKTVGYIKARVKAVGVDGSPHVHMFDWNERIVINDKITFAGKIEDGDVITFQDREWEVAEVIEAHPEPEVAMCSLGSIILPNIPEDDDEAFENAMYHALKMIDYSILNSSYPLPHIGVTAKKRMNAGVGLMGLATHMAKKGLTYDSMEGLEEIHKIAEKYMYFAIKASLRISKERGLAPWIHKTNWPNGWLPIDSYNRNVDSIGDFKLQYDWEALREEVIENGGIAHSVLLAQMPQESSSKISSQPNSLYPVRDTTLVKTDGGITVRWAAPDSDDPNVHYQSAWDILEEDMIKVYAIFQKFMDQGISADLWKSVKGNDKVTSRELLTQYFNLVKYGIKSRYYFNSNTTTGNALIGESSMGVTGESGASGPGTVGGFNADYNDTSCEGCSM